MRLAHWSLAAFTVFVAAIVGCSQSETNDTAVMVEGDDPEMEAAISTARGKLPEFWRIFETRPNAETGFALKVHITDGHGDEHFWVGDIERKDGKVYGTIDNEPSLVKSVSLGQRIEVPEDRISDWLYMRSGKMVGNYTIRALFKTMPAKEVEELKAILSDP